MEQQPPQQQQQWQYKPMQVQQQPQQQQMPQPMQLQQQVPSQLSYGQQPPPLFLQQQSQMQAQYSQMQYPGGSGFGGGASVKRLPTKDYSKEKMVASVIATVYSGSSYDDLFRKVEQEPPEEGTAVSLFQFTYEVLDEVSKCMRGEEITGANAEIIKEFCVDVGRAEPQSVVLNFECCSCASDNGFSGSAATSVIQITKLFLERQHMVMFGDFSVKALIKNWDAALLGPNPFVRVGELSSSFDLRFDPQTLINCPSSQLATAGELCSKGEAHVHALGGTVMFTIDQAATDNRVYTLDVLSVAVAIDGQAPPSTHRLVSLPTDASVKGVVGHALLRYPSAKAGGQDGLLLVSMGHWIELARLDVNLEGIIKHAEKTYGAAYAQNLSEQIRSAPVQAQQAQMQAYACSAVQKSSPAYYSKKG